MADLDVAARVTHAPDVAHVTVRYFAAAAEAAGREYEELSLPADASLATLRDTLVARYPALERVLLNGSFLADGVVTRSFDRPLPTSVDVLPPFAGG